MSAALTIENLYVTYDTSNGSYAAIQDFSLQLSAGQTVCVLGPSGSGKTTVLRAIAGFERVQAGRIMLNDQVLSSDKIHVPPERRNMGMVFQDYALFPHLNVTRNVAFGLQKRDRMARNERVKQMLDLVGLSDMGDRYPHQLSGGQQQRIALVRALAPEPQLLLLDEPFSSLDQETSQRLQVEMRAILQQTKQTVLLVTHNHQEARALADQVITMGNDAV